MNAMNWNTFSGGMALLLALLWAGCAEQESGNDSSSVEASDTVEERGAEEVPTEEYALPEVRNDEACAPDQNLLLNEIVVAGVDNGPNWVEVYNCTNTAISLDGWSLRVESANTDHAFTASTSIPANGFFVIEGKNSTQEGAADFVLGNEDTLLLFDPDSNQADSLSWEEGDSPEGLSYGRYPDGGSDIGTLSEATYNMPNAPLASEETGTESGQEGETEEEAETAGEENTNETSFAENSCETGSNLVINEVLAASNEDKGGWVELFNCSDEGVALEGWVILDNEDENSFTFPAGITVEANAHFIVMGQDTDQDLSLGFEINGDDTIRLFDTSGQQADFLDWEEGDAPEGQSYGRYPDGGPEVGTLSQVTPGSPNAKFSDGTETTEGTESAEEAGEESPPAGLAIRISEVMYDPSAVNDKDGEWFEIYNAGTESIDLRELEFSDKAESFEALKSDTELLLEPGEYAVLARSADTATNGFVVAAGEFSFSLVNGDDTLIIRHQGTELDRFEYGSFEEATGMSLQQSPETLQDIDTDAMGGTWCVATQPYGAGDLGTPGTDNEACASDAENSEETGEIEFGEPTSVFISEFLVNPAAVNDNKGEWIELTNGGTQPVNLKGLTIAENAKEILITDTVIVEAEQSIVIARSDDPATNGGVDNVAYVLTGANLNNPNDSIILRDEDGTELDRIDYDEATGWLIEEGVALQLDPSLAGTPGEHNDPAFWCLATTAYGDGDLGTPGAFNPPCEGEEAEEESEESSGGAEPNPDGVTTTGKVYINEVMAKAADGGQDWIELFNSGGKSVDLSGWQLVDDDVNTATLPEGTTIAAAGYLQVIKGDDSTPDAPQFDFGLGADDAIQLLEPGLAGALIDVLDWNDGDAPEGLSYGRYPDGAATTGTLASPTAAAANVDFVAGVAPVTEHICDTECDNFGAVGDLPCYCDDLCFYYGDCCNATGTQFSDGCTGSSCGACQPPGSCCAPGECDSDSCTTCVCESDPSCCAGVWDASCSALANGVCKTACSCY